MKHTEGTVERGKDFSYEQVYLLLEFLQKKNIHIELAPRKLKVLYHYPKMDFESILDTIKFKQNTQDEILSKIPFLKTNF
jgi:hypothetical protein